MYTQKGFVLVLLLVSVFILLGIFSTYYFNSIQTSQDSLKRAKEISTSLQSVIPQSEGDGSRCDLNLDGICDENDRILLKSMIGNCSFTNEMQLKADSDSDGCISQGDGLRLFGSSFR